DLRPAVVYCPYAPPPRPCPPHRRHRRLRLRRLSARAGRYRRPPRTDRDRPMTPRRLLILAAAAPATPGCERTPVPPSATARPLVVASFFTLWDFCRQVTGERAEGVSLGP